MKKCFIHIFVAVLILSSAFPTFSVSALSSPRFIEHEPQILRNEQVRLDPLGPEAPGALVFPEPSLQDRMPNADLPEDGRAHLLGQTEPVEERAYILPTAEQIAQTKIQADSFDCTTVTDVPREECEALVALYASTNGAGWTGSPGWLTGTTVDSWYGVTVTNSHVNILLLSSYQLNGSIPSQLGNLPNLVYLDLSYNQLNGSIPSQLGALTNLGHLDLSDNDLTGSIPTELVNLTKLDNWGLDLSNNRLNLSGYFTTLLDFLALKDPDWEDTQRGGTFTGCAYVTSIPVIECEALLALYDSTNGAEWWDSTNWLVDANPNVWFGVYVEGGKVIKLDLSDNNLIGNIPIELVNLINIVNGGLDLSINLLNLSGYTQDLLDFLTHKDPNWEDTQRGGPFYDCEDVNSIPVIECEALVALFENTNRGWWEDNAYWLEDANPNIWKGVSVEGGHVTELDLSDNNLIGNIPPELGNLTSLTGLYLGVNLLNGSIPSELGKLINLQGLNLSSNQLSGSIPSEVGNLPRLGFLNLSFNQLSGNIPTELGNLANLYILNLSSTKLTGSIPLSFSNLSGLGYFDFTNTKLCAPADVDFQEWKENVVGAGWSGTGATCPTFDCSTGAGVSTTECEALVALYANTTGWEWSVRFGWLTATTVASWAGVTVFEGHVTELNLSGNNLTGSIPGQLGDLTSLELLDLSVNQLTGSIPGQLGNLTSLVELSLILNQLTGSIPPQLGNLTSLENLSLGGNQLTGSIPPQLGNLTNLEFLDLSFNQLSGRIPSQLGNLTSLVELWLGSNQLTGNIPTELGSLTNLTDLDLSYNPLTGSIPLSFSNLSGLVNFYFNETNLCEPADADFQEWKANVDVAGWIGTEVTCPIFDCSTVTGVSTTECEALVALYVNTTGWEWWDNFGWLEYPTIGDWPGVSVEGGQVTMLNLPYNQLNGSIPSQLGDLTSLSNLDLSDNQLTGRIPSQLGDLTSLGELNLGFNQLTGNIPLSFTNLSTLEYFDFEYTNLCEPTNQHFQAWKEFFGESYWNGTELTCIVPVAVAEAYTTPEDTELVIVAAQGLLANDSDIDEDPLFAILVDNVTNGTLALAADGSFTYTPNLDFTGEDSFTYEATDGELYSNGVTVTINVNQVLYSIYLPLIIK